MTSSLLVFRGRAHDPQSILAAVYELALVGLKLFLKIVRSIHDTKKCRAWYCELVATIGANCYGWHGTVVLHDPNGAFCHDLSLAHLAWRQ